MDTNQTEVHALYIIQCIQKFIEDEKQRYLPDFFRLYSIPHALFYFLVKHDDRVNNYFYHMKNVLCSRNYERLVKGGKNMSRYEAETCAYLMRKYDPYKQAMNQLEVGNPDLIKYDKTTQKDLLKDLSPEMRKIYDANVERKATLIAKNTKAK